MPWTFVRIRRLRFRRAATLGFVLEPILSFPYFFLEPVLPALRRTHWLAYRIPLPL